MAMTHVNTSINFTIWWDHDSGPDRIRLLTGDPRFTIEGDTGPWLQPGSRGLQPAPVQPTGPLPAAPGLPGSR